MDRQAVFDKVATHLLTQNKTSESSSGQCLYRSTNGDTTLMCAIGCLIPDDKYDPFMEGQSIDMDAPDVLAALDYLDITNDIDIEFLGNLQDVHDCGATYEWLSYLEDLGESYNLNTSVLDKFRSVQT